MFLGLIDIGFHDYMQTVIQNVTDEKVVLPAGIAVCQLLVIKSKIPKFEIGWEDLKSRNGSFGSTGNNFEQVQANLCRVEHENVHLVRNNVLGAIDLIDPREVNLGNISLKFLGNNEKRADQLTELLDFEKRTFCNYNAILEKIPTIECFNIEYDNMINDPDDLNENEEKIECKLPELSEKDKSALLVADLCENKRISLDLFSQLQDNDKNIRKIKKDIVENENAYKYFVMRNSVICRQYSIKTDSSFFLGVYVPDSILYAVIIYVHKFYHHPSLRQTFKQFRNLYYHPKAKQAVKLVCDSCLTCAKTRNFTANKPTVGRNRSLNPKQPRAFCIFQNQLVVTPMVYLWSFCLQCICHFTP